MTTNSMLRTLGACALALAMLAADRPATAACDCSTLTTLGRAENYPALGFGGFQVHLQGSTFASNGNVGTGPGGSVYLHGAAGTSGHVGHHFGTTVTGGAKAMGGVFEQDMSGPVADAIAASAAYAAMTATQTFSSLTNNTTITGNGCINVIQINGDIDIGGNKSVVFKGTSDDYFVVNVTGSVETSGNADIVLDGLDPHQVVINFTSAGESGLLGGNSGGNLTFLNPGGDLYLHGNAGGTGAYYAGATRLHFQGSTDFTGAPFGCAVVPVCPDPEYSGVNIQTPATPPSRSTGNVPLYHAYFNPGTFEGHLESYKLNPAGVLKDKNNVDAIDPATDQIESTAVPFWDAGEELKTNTTRKLYTTIGGARTDWSTSNVSQSDLAFAAGEFVAYPNYPASGINNLNKLHDAIEGYVRGQDAFDEDGDSNETELRDAVLGDIFHSNALFIGTPTSYLAAETGYAGFQASYNTRDRVVYAGANDALLHAFEAGAHWDPTDPSAFNAGTGEELFGYLPGLLLPVAKITARNYDITGARLVPGFVDGNTVAADVWLGDGSGSDITKTASEYATVLIAAYREGGRGYLALDITDPAAAGAPHGPYPKLQWEFTDGDMGQSWSRPVVTRVKVKGTFGSGDHCGEDDGDGDCREQWVAIFGAGYELDGDPHNLLYVDDPTSPAWSDRSKAILMVAMDSGQVLARVAFDNSGATGPADMKFSIPSAPAVLDTNGDGFGDIVTVGDVGGQMWKWVINAVGTDGVDADTELDNWPYGVFFRVDPVTLASGDSHYKQMFSPPAASFVNGVLHIAFGTGERRDTQYQDDASADDENRFYVVQDLNPLSIGATITESDLTDVTATGTYTDPGNLGYFLVAEPSEKFVTDVLIFAGYALAASYIPDSYPACTVGEAFFYAFGLGNGEGFYDTDANPEAADRRVKIGNGIPSNPRVSIGSDPADDKVVITTSDGQVLTLEPPLRDPPESELIYWKQNF